MRSLLIKLHMARIAVFGGPREKFSASEFEAIRQYIGDGGSVLVMLGEGGESSFGTNINFLLEECGINVNSGMAILVNRWMTFEGLALFGGSLCLEESLCHGRPSYSCTSSTFLTFN